MPTTERTVHVDSDPAAVFDYVSEVANLPRYFDSMTSAEATGPEEVHVTAEVPDGGHQEGTAWFRVDEERRRLEWGSERTSSYSGWLEVGPDGDGSEVRLGITMERDDEDDGIGRTLDNLRRQIEG